MEITVEHVRQMKGAPLAVLVLLSTVALPVTQEWLERFSGYSDKPVSQALAYLLETGKVVQMAGGWLLAEAPAQGPVRAGRSGKNHPAEEEHASSGLKKHIFQAGQEPKNRGEARKSGTSRNFSDQSLSSSKNLLRSKDLKNLKDSNTTKSKTRKRKISETEREELWDEFRRLNLRRNARTEALLEMPHITVDYLRSMQEKLEREGRSGPRHTGLLVHALESAEPLEHAGESVKERVEKFLGRRIQGG